MRKFSTVSKIPIPLPKTKANPVKEVVLSRSENKAPEMPSTVSTKSSVNNECVVSEGALAQHEEVEEREIAEIKETNNKKIVVKNPLHGLPSSPPNPEENDETVITQTTIFGAPRKRRGEGDEIQECLEMVDGLSGHTTWVMNKILQFPKTGGSKVKIVKPRDLRTYL